MNLTDRTTPRISITFNDLAKSQRLLLLTRHFEDAEAALAAFRALAPVDGYTTFVASLRRPDGKFEHLPLDAELLEHISSTPIGLLLAAARANRPMILGAARGDS